MKSKIALITIIFAIFLIIGNCIIFFSSPLIGFPYVADSDNYSITFNNDNIATIKYNNDEKKINYSVMGNVIELDTTIMYKYGYSYKMSSSYGVVTFTCYSAIILQIIILLFLLLCIYLSISAEKNKRKLVTK